MNTIRASKEQIPSCLDLAEKITFSAIGAHLSKEGAESVGKWLRSSASGCEWFMSEHGVCAYDPEESRIVFLGVEENYRRQGEGTALVDAVRKTAEETNQSRITANALGSALEFYKNCGFEETDRMTEAGELRFAPVEYLLGRRYLGKTVKIIIDRPFGSLHPHIADLEYELNFGYVSGDSFSDGDLQDAWVYGIYEPRDTFTGTVIAIIYHKNGGSRLVAAPSGMMFSKEDVIAAVGFEEQYFDTRIIWASSMN